MENSTYEIYIHLPTFTLQPDHPTLPRNRQTYEAYRGTSLSPDRKRARLSLLLIWKLTNCTWIFHPYLLEWIFGQVMLFSSLARVLFGNTRVKKFRVRIYKCLLDLLWIQINLKIPVVIQINSSLRLKMDNF